MTLQEASRRYHICPEKLKLYEENELLEHRTMADGSYDYTEESVRRVGLIHDLMRTGMKPETIKKYLSLKTDDPSGRNERVRLLQKQRFELMTQLHDKQSALDTLDDLIREEKQRK